MATSSSALHAATASTAGLAHAATTSLHTASVLIGNVLVFLIVTVLLVIFSMRAGRQALISLILSLYTGYALYSVFPFISALVKPGATDSTSAIITIAIYGVLVFISYLLVRRVSSGHVGSIHFLPLLLLCILTGGFLMALGYQLFDITHVYALPKTLNLLFAPKQYFFWWFIAPLVGVFFLAR
jgi:hypothetical protein